MNNSPEFHDALLSLESKDAFSDHGGWKRVNNLLIFLELEVWLQRFIVNLKVLKITDASSPLTHNKTFKAIIQINLLCTADRLYC